MRRIFFRSFASFLLVIRSTQADEQKPVAPLAKPEIMSSSSFPGHPPENVLGAGKPWLAENKVAFPVDLTIQLPGPVEVDAVELTQTAWDSGDYRTKNYTLETSSDGATWTEVAQGTMPNTPNAILSNKISGSPVRLLRIRILDSHDTEGAFSCGLNRVRLLHQGHEVSFLPARYQSFDCRAVKDGTVRDHLWLWSHFQGAYNGGMNAVPGVSHFSALDGAKYMGIPNLIFIQWHGKPAAPFGDYAAPFSAFKRVVWSAFNNDGEVSSLSAVAPTLELASQMPNLTGAIMDDFFHGRIGDPAQVPSNLTIQELGELKTMLNKAAGRPVDLGVVIYAQQLSEDRRPFLELCDTVSFWTWKAEDLPKLAENFAKLKQLAPGKRILLGCYMWDFGDSKPIPVEMMKLQCELGLKWLRSGEIDGLIFLGANVCDRNLEAVEWAREWIAEVGNQPVKN